MTSQAPDVVAVIERATHMIATHLEHELADLGMTQGEAHVLARLSEGATSPNELHRAFGHKRSTLTSILDRLEARGYVKREIHPDDRRSFLISLTRDGAAAAATVTDAVACLQQLVAATTSAAEWAGFTAVVGALEAAIAGAATA